MKRAVSYLIILIVLVSLSSCDFMRTLAGRPTSVDLITMQQNAVSDNSNAASDKSNMAAEFIAKDSTEDTDKSNLAAESIAKDNAIDDSEGITNDGTKDSANTITTDTSKGTSNVVVNTNETATTISEELKSESKVTSVQEAKPEQELTPEYEPKKREGRLSVPFAYTHTTSTLKKVPEYKYYILVGTYRHKSTLDKMVADAKEAGFKAYLLEYNNDLTSVALMPCNDLAEAIDNYAEVKKSAFCPHDACVLIAK